MNEYKKQENKPVEITHEPTVAYVGAIRDEFEKQKRELMDSFSRREQE